MQFSNPVTRAFFARMLKLADGDMCIVGRAMDKAVKEKRSLSVKEKDVAKWIMEERRG